MPASSLDFLTHHEAGHAAIAHLFGLRLSAVSIDAAADSGATDLRPNESPTPLQCALVLLAGGRAEKVLDAECLRHRISTARDEATLLTLISERLGPKLMHRPIEYVDAIGERLDERLAECCERLVRQRWPAIQRLAAALTLQHKIGGPEAEALLSC